MEQKQMEKKMKAYLKAGKGAARGKKRATKKLKKMATNDMITFFAKKATGGATNHPAWYTKLGGDLIGLNYGAIDHITPRADLIRGYGGNQITIRTTTDAIIYLAIVAPQGDNILRTAAQKIVNELRLVSGANTIYDVDDMIDYLLNIRSIWVALTQIRRAIRCLNVTDPYDIDAWRKYLMMALNDTNISGTAVGFSSEFREKAASIVNWLNTIVKSVRFMMPGNFSLFERTQWLFSNIFVDGTGVKFGSKMFVAKEVPTYTHSGVNHTGTTHQLFNNAQTVANLMSEVENMVTDFTTYLPNVAIAGDLMKAYGMASFYDPGQIAFTEKVPFIYDERALEQIANADVVGDRRCVGVYSYANNTPNFEADMSAFSITEKEYAVKTCTHHVKFVNTSDNEVESGETLSLTRLKTSILSEVESGNLTKISSVNCGTEIVVEYAYVVGFTTNNGVEVLNDWGLITMIRVGTNYPGLMETMSLWSIDDYGPMCLLYDPNNQDPTANAWVAMPIFDFSNWALMSRTEERQFHKTACLSLLTPTASVVQQAVAKL